MGDKLKDLGFNAGRKDVDTIDPKDLSLVWHKKTPEMGPNDFVVCPDPEWAFDASIENPINPEHVELALTKQGGKYVGILEPIGYRKVEYKGKLRLFVVFGRGRTRMAREANARIKKLGGSEADFIFVPATVKTITDTEAAILRDVENLHRKILKPIDLARLAQQHIDQGTPEPIVLKLFGVKSMQQVKNYAALLKQPEPVQRLIADGKIPMSAKIEPKQAAKVVEAAEKSEAPLSMRDIAEIQGTAKSKMMTRGAIEKWHEKASGIEKATLAKVLGL